MRLRLYTRKTVFRCYVTLIPAMAALLLPASCRQEGGSTAAPQNASQRSDAPQPTLVAADSERDPEPEPKGVAPTDGNPGDPAPIELPTTASVEASAAGLESAQPVEGNEGRGDRGDVEHTAIEVPKPDLTDAEPQVAEFFRQAYERVLEDPQSGDNWGRYGLACHAHFLNQLAERCYTRAVELDPSDFRWLYLLGIVRKQTGGDLDEVISTFERAIKINDDYPPIHFHLGECMARTGQDSKAVAAYQRALELRPKMGVAHRGLGQVRLAEGKPEEALRHLERAAEIMPGDGGTQTLLARVYTRLGDTERAEEAAEKAAQLPKVTEPDDLVLQSIASMDKSTAAATRRAREQMREGDFLQAIADLELVVDALPDDAEMRVDLATAYLNTGMHDKAVESLEKAIELRPELVASYVKLGWVHRVMGDLEKAEEVFRKGLELAPDDFRFHAGLSMVYTDNGEYDKAVAAAERALELQPESGELHNILGYALQQRGDLERARASYEEALRLQPRHPQVKQRLADVRQELEQPKDSGTHETDEQQP